jgi:hypothetical protein
VRLRRIHLERSIAFPYHYEFEANDNGWPDWFEIVKFLRPITPHKFIRPIR